VVGGLERGEWELDSCVSCSILGRTEAIQTWGTERGEEIERKENWRERERWGDAEMQIYIGRKKVEEKKKGRKKR
jgi:hypothetical protein